jgi:hypothetical protein
MNTLGTQTRRGWAFNVRFLRREPAQLNARFWPTAEILRTGAIDSTAHYFPSIFWSKISQTADSSARYLFLRPPSQIMNARIGSKRRHKSIGHCTDSSGVPASNIPPVRRPTGQG